MMIEFNSHIEDLIFDPVSQKYKVSGSRSDIRTNIKSKSSGKHSHSSTVNFKMKPPESKRIGNLIEKKGLHVDFIIK